MKYKTFMLFRNLAGAGIAGVAAVGAFVGCRNMAKVSATVPSPTVSLPPSSFSPAPIKKGEFTPIKPGGPGPNAKVVGTTVKDGKTYLVWSDGHVTPKGAGNPGAAASGGVAPTGATAALSQRDKEVIALRKEPLSNGKPSGDSVKWVAVGSGFKAEFRADSGSKAWDRVKLDFDSDKKWDERWDFKSDGSIKRRIAPGDDENYSVEYRLKKGETKWMRAK